MLKSQIMQRLSESISTDGDECLGTRGLIALLNDDGGRELAEYDAREKIIRSIVRAKREIHAPMDSDFFADIWPKAAALLKASR